ncbi:hypothetical protein I4U23_022931 [Adineta vaga]|nr:hypothetical protein I4U23_022931 [Adineta vaga]
MIAGIVIVCLTVPKPKVRKCELNFELTAKNSMEYNYVSFTFGLWQWCTPSCKHVFSTSDEKILSTRAFVTISCIL